MEATNFRCLNVPKTTGGQKGMGQRLGKAGREVGRRWGKRRQEVGRGRKQGAREGPGAPDGILLQVEPLAASITGAKPRFSAVSFKVTLVRPGVPFLSASLCPCHSKSPGPEGADMTQGLPL